MQTERRTYVADTPGDGALLAGGGRLVGLAFNAQVHNMVTANGAVVDDDVPRPESDGVPLELDQQLVRDSVWGFSPS
jgi:hypothetical protein